MPQPQPTFTILRIYLKDASFEAPGGHGSFTHDWRPETSLDTDVAANQVAEDTFEVATRITVTAHNAGTVAYQAEAVQAGLFKVAGFDAATKDRVLHAVCPNALFPYLREVIDSMVVKASFPPQMLAPIDWDTLYLDLMRRSGQTPG
jgi:preprotein translocase subunit SecB